MKAGEILNDTYEIVGQIGSGGGGTVYKARHLRLETDVVVKKIKDEVIGRTESRQEADILKGLKHPYLPRVYDFIEAEDGVYTVMEFIQGEDLCSAVRHHGAYPQKQVRKWAEQLGEALSYLHGQNPPVIHSDIKPENIMLTKDGDVCLIDFNVSLAVGGSMESAVGISAGFSPPEQYHDSALYERITHSYTKRKGLRVFEGEAGDKIEKSDISGGTDEPEDCAELLCSDVRDSDEIGSDISDESDDKTEILSDSEREEIQRRQKWVRVRAQSENGRSDSSVDIPEYEHYIGKGIDTRSDIYSLGVTLCFLLTGVDPPLDFDRRLSVEKAGVSEGFTLILEKMTEISPDERYQNGSEFLSAVRDCYKLDSRYRRMRRKQGAMQVAALVSLVSGILLMFGGMYLVRREENAEYYRILQQAEEAMKLSDYEEAEKLLGEAKEVSGTRVDAYAEEVHMLYLSEQYDACIRLCENYINTTPFLIETRTDEELLGDIYYIMGNAYIEIGDYDNARAALAEAVQFNDRNGLYYRDYAVALAKLGQTEAAAMQLEEGIELGLAQDSVYIAQGEITHAEGQYDNAVEYLWQTIRTTDDMQMKKKAVLLCADVYKEMGGEAVDLEIELLEQYIGQFEGNGSLVMTEYLAESYARKAGTDGTMADVYYGKALELFNSIYDKGYVTYRLQENMAILYENMDSFAEAEEMLTQMSESYPERYEVYKRLAFLEADKQQMKENEERDYGQMSVYHERAKELYAGKEQDMEMDMLDRMMSELKDGGWL
ncbi:MAG: protein kinase [Lachnospiraceae bacterium]|nr:protein kinase [Lachnospiraceae bacterium]